MRNTSPYLTPEHIFLLFALVFGAIYALLLPPLAGPDEYFHYQRIASVAYGYWANEEATVPSGIAQLMKTTLAYQAQGNLLPYATAHWYELAAVPLAADQMATLTPSYMTIHSFVNYLPQAAMFRLGAALNASPLMLLYVARLTALLFSVLVTFHAIRIIPSWRYGLCALALLPPMEFYRICLSADTVTTALGLWFLACVMREVVRTDLIKRASLLRMVVLGFLLPLCKLPYMAATILSLAISRKRFSTVNAKLVWCCLIIVPGALAGLWWMESTRHGVFSGLEYDTWGGHAFPDQQLVGILAHPVAFAEVLLDTVFSLGFYADALKEMFGHFGTMAQTNFTYYGVMYMLLAIALWMDGTAVKASYSLRTKLLTIPIAGAFLLLTLAALYIHWNGVGATTIKGFQGRYIYPLLPLCLMVLPFRGRPHAPITSALAAGMFALVGLSQTVLVLLAHWG